VGLFPERANQRHPYESLLALTDQPAIEINKRENGAVWRLETEKVLYDPSKYKTYLEQLGIATDREVNSFAESPQELRLVLHNARRAEATTNLVRDTALLVYIALATVVLHWITGHNMDSSAMNLPSRGMRGILTGASSLIPPITSSVWPSFARFFLGLG